MGRISEQVNTLRDVAEAYKHNGLYMILREAADTIETLSAKASAANMERSDRHYNDGWIPCSKRLPEDNQKVIVCLKHGHVVVLDFCSGKFHGIYHYTPDDVIAWQPMPEAYHEQMD